MSQPRFCWRLSAVNGYTLNMKLRLLVVFLICGAQPAFSADDTLQNYDVELLIFRVVRPTATPENWALESAGDHATAASAGDGEDTPITTTTLPAPATTASPNADAPPLAAEPAFPALQVSQFKLNGMEETLRKGKTFLPIAHIGWTQPGYPLNNTPKFSIQSYIPAFLPDNIALSGQASLARGRYLHLLLDLTYQAPDGQRYVLHEQRRMRSTEKHYFDHPYFGVIVSVTPKN